VLREQARHGEEKRAAREHGPKLLKKRPSLRRHFFIVSRRLSVGKRGFQTSERDSFGSVQKRDTVARRCSFGNPPVFAMMETEPA